MRGLFLVVMIGWFCALAAPVVLADTKAPINDSARLEDELCKGRDGAWYLPGSKECGDSPTSPTAPAEKASKPIKAEQPVKIRTPEPRPYNGISYKAVEKDSSGSVLSGLLFLLAMGAIYFLPSGAAVSRAHPQTTAIFILNLFLGWTFLFWVIALVWAFANRKPS